MGGSPSNARVALFELMRAVNEREAAVGMAETEFFKADGTEAANVAVTDLVGIYVAGNSSLAYQNLVRIQDAIVALIESGNFTALGDADSVYTVASMETAIDTSIQDPPLRPQEARFWQAQKDALDLLIYRKVAVTTFDTGVDGYTTGTYGIGATPAVAWGNRGDNTYPDPSQPLGAQVLWSVTDTGPLASPWAGIVRDYTESSPYLTDGYAGVLAESFYGWLAVYSNPPLGDVITDPGTLQATCNTTEISFSSASPGAVRYTLAEAGDITISADTQVIMSLDSTPPGTSPFDTGDGGFISININNLRLHLDLSTLLTDQA